MKQTLSGIPRQLPAPILALGSGALNLFAAAPVYVWIQARSRQGFNELSPSAVASTGTDALVSLDITIPSNARPVGCEVVEFLVLAAYANDPAEAVNVASIPGDSALPATVTLNDNEHLLMGDDQLLATEAELPMAPVVGTRRHVDTWGEVREWDGSQWTPSSPQTLSTYIASIDGMWGARESLIYSDIVLPVRYGATGAESEVLTYWMVNDTGVTIPDSRQISCIVECGGVDISSEISNGALWMAFAGYVDSETAIQDLGNAQGTGEMAGIDYWFEYPGPFTGMALPKPLPPGHAVAISFKLSFDDSSFRYAAREGQRININLSLEPYTAHLFLMGLFTGSLMSGDLGRRRLLPAGRGLTMIAQSGSGCVKTSDTQAYLFRRLSSQVVIGLLPNQADQSVYITAQGDTFVSATGGDTVALRAIVGTVNGVGFPTPWRSVALTASTFLDVATTYPQVIRNDYPDAIAGTAAPCNADHLRIYLKNPAGDIVYWDSPITLDVASQVHRVGATAGTAIASVPSPATPGFGLFALEPDDYTETTPAGSSAFAPATYEYCVAFVYNSTITAVSHRESGCIVEAEGTLADVFDLPKYYKDPVAAPADLALMDRAFLYDGALVPVVSVEGKVRLFVWNAASTTTPDSLFVVQLADGLIGRFIAVGEKSALNPRGEYSPLTAYAPGDYVTYLRGSYAATAATTGNPPTDPAYWQLLVESGSTIHPTPTNPPDPALGTLGDYALTSTDPATLFGPKTGAGWGTGMQLVGDAGADGQPGLGLRYSPGVALVPPPTSGQLLFNDASLASVTEIYVSTTARTGVGVGSILNTLTAGSKLLIFDEFSDAAFAFYQLVSLVDNTTYITLSVAHEGSGAAAFGETISLGFSVAGGQGEPGVAGRTILPTAGVPGAELGEDGDFALDTAASLLYGPKVAGSWGSPVSIKGDPGATGSVTAASTLNLTEQGSTPTTPAAGTWELYAKAAGIYALDDAGAETLLGASAVAWGDVTGTLSAQTDLQTALDAKAPLTPDINAQTGTTYTLVLSDAHGLVTMSNASANTLTIPANASVAFPTGTVIEVWQLGAGATTIETDTGVTLNGVSAGGVALGAAYAPATLRKIGTNAWIIAVGGAANVA